MTPARVRRVVLDVLAVVLPALGVLATQDGRWFPLVSGLVACAALVVRHWFPRLVVVLCLPAMAGGLGWAPTVVALVRLGRARSNSWWLAWAVAAVVAAAMVPVLVFERLPMAQLLVTLAFSMLAAGSPVVIGSLISTRRQLTSSLLRLREATEAESFAKAETARAEERAHIAREIHDAVGHHVTMIAVEAAALTTVSEDPQVRESASRLRGLAKEALGEMRSTLGLVAEQRDAAGAPAIPDLVERARESGVQVELRDELDPGQELPPRIGRALYRAVQEALTNVSKHAPGSPVLVRLSCADGMVRAEVSNAAPAAVPGRPRVDVGSGGTGLEGLSERVRMLGGAVEAEPSADGGFALRVRLPWEAPQ